MLIREIVGKGARLAAVAITAKPIFAFRGDPSRRGIARRASAPVSLAAAA
jgi:hypothetical protein